MGSHCSFGHMKHKLWAKERANLTPDQIKSGINPIYLFTKGVQHTVEKLSTIATTLIGGLLAKLWGSKVVGVPTWVISGLPLGSPETKNHLDVGFVANHKIYYKGEGGGFPQVWAVVNLVCPCCLWLSS
jgi:hypothetical protein